MLQEGKGETEMRFFLMAGILGATLAVTTSAAFAEGNADQPYVQALTRATQASGTLSAADTRDSSAVGDPWYCQYLDCRQGGDKR